MFVCNRAGLRARLLRFMACLLFAVALTACHSSRSARPTPIAPSVEGAFFAITTGDVDRLTAWYSENLGFRVDFANRAADGGPKSALLSREGALLELMQFPAGKSRKAWGLPEEAHLVHGILKLGFKVADIDRVYARAKALGLDEFFPLVKPRDNPLRTFGLKDPDGNIVQFFGK
jgi:hypothetical protein